MCVCVFQRGAAIHVTATNLFKLAHLGTLLPWSQPFNHMRIPPKAKSLPPNLFNLFHVGNWAVWPAAKGPSLFYLNLEFNVGCFEIFLSTFFVLITNNTKLTYLPGTNLANLEWQSSTDFQERNSTNRLFNNFTLKFSCIPYIIDNFPK